MLNFLIKGHKISNCRSEEAPPEQVVVYIPKKKEMKNRAYLKTPNFKKRKGAFGIDAIIMILASMAGFIAVFAVTALINTAGGLYASELWTNVPTFYEYTEDGVRKDPDATSPYLRIYYMFAGGAAVVFVVVMGRSFIFWMLSDIVPNDGGYTSNPGVAAAGDPKGNAIKIIKYSVIILLVPVIWDPVALATEKVSLFLFAPFPDEWGGDKYRYCTFTGSDSLVAAKLLDCPQGSHNADSWSDQHIRERAEIRTRALWSSISGGIDIHEILSFDTMATMVSNPTLFIETILVKVFLGIFKGFAVVGLTIELFVASIARIILNMLGLVILPMALALGMLNSQIQQHLTTAYVTILPMFLLIPIITALVFMVGSHYLETYEQSFASETHVWLSELIVAYLVAGIPAAFVPAVGAISSQVSSAVSSTMSMATNVVGGGIGAVGGAMAAGGGTPGTGDKGGTSKAGTTAIGTPSSGTGKTETKGGIGRVGTRINTAKENIKTGTGRGAGFTRAMTGFAQGAGEPGFKDGMAKVKGQIESQGTLLGIGEALDTEGLMGTGKDSVSGKLGTRVTGVPMTEAEQKALEERRAKDRDNQQGRKIEDKVSNTPIDGRGGLGESVKNTKGEIEEKDNTLETLSTKEKDLMEKEKITTGVDKAKVTKALQQNREMRDDVLQSRQKLAEQLEEQEEEYNEFNMAHTENMHIQEKIDAENDKIDKLNQRRVKAVRKGDEDLVKSLDVQVKNANRIIDAQEFLRQPLREAMAPHVMNQLNHDLNTKEQEMKAATEKLEGMKKSDDGYKNAFNEQQTITREHGKAQRERDDYQRIRNVSNETYNKEVQKDNIQNDVYNDEDIKPEDRDREVTKRTYKKEELPEKMRTWQEDYIDKDPDGRAPTADEINTQEKKYLTEHIKEEEESGGYLSEANKGKYT